MALVSMNDVLKDVRSYSKTAGNAIRLHFEVQKKTQRSYMSFQIGRDIVEQTGWKKGDYVNFIWDTEKKSAVLESATQSTGRPLHMYSPRIMQVRFQYVEGYGLPTLSQVGSNVKARKGRVAFTLGEEK